MFRKVLLGMALMVSIGVGAAAADGLAVPQGGGKLPTIALVECLAAEGSRSSGQYCRATYECSPQDGAHVGGTLWEGLTYHDGRRVTLETDDIAVQRKCTLSIEDPADVWFYTGYRPGGKTGKVVGMTRAVLPEWRSGRGGEGCLATPEQPCRDGAHLPEAECEGDLSVGWVAIGAHAGVTEGHKVLYHRGYPELEDIGFSARVYRVLNSRSGIHHAFWRAERGFVAPYDVLGSPTRHGAGLEYLAPAVDHAEREQLTVTYRVDGLCASTTLRFWIVDTD